MERAANFQDFLIQSLENKKDLEHSFNSLLTSLSEELELKPVKSNIHIEKSKIHFPIEDIFSMGVRRGIEEEKLHLTISSKYREFFPFILLREAYYCFLPLKALNIKQIKICINLIVEIKLESHPAIDKWKPLIRKHSIDRESKIYERFGKFFKSNPDIPKNPIKFFFKYIRGNMRIITEETALDDKVFQEYLFKTSRNLYDDEIIETIRILIKIFYRIELFTTLSEYGELFTKFKRSGFIKTDLSLRKFQNNLRWLKKYSYIAPNYKVRYERLNMQPFVLVIQFHPFYASSKANIKRFLEHFPFLRYIRTQHTGFSLSSVGYIFIPRDYKRDLINFLNVMKAEKYVLNTYLIQLSNKENNLNLNYFREFHDREIIINRDQIFLMNY